MNFDLDLSRFEPIKWYSYPHQVTHGIIQNEPYNRKQYRRDEDQIYLAWTAVCAEAEISIGYKVDNKTVIELENDGTRLFIGKYDDRITIGFGVHKITW